MSLKVQKRPAQQVVANATSSAPVSIPRFIDIGVNLTDKVFRGRGRSGQHPDDFADMLRRSRAAGVRNMTITGGSLNESQHALRMAKDHGMFATVGCHPTRSQDFDKFEDGPEAYLRALDNTITKYKTGKGRVVAVGDPSPSTLDYDRLFFSPAETQKKYFRMQLGLAKKHNLPLFLHSRNCHADFVQILREEGFGEDGGRALGGRGGVVHSFTGVKEEIDELLEMGFHFSLNGCGMKTQQNLEAAAKIPLDRLLLETDAPWCSLTPTHASSAHLKTLPKPLSDLFFPPSSKTFEQGKMVKGRNEPNAIGGVAWVVAKLHGVTLEEVAEACWKNTCELFGFEEGLSEMDVPKVVSPAPVAAPAASRASAPSLMSESAFPALGRR
ncbi:hypothetical protein FRC04_010917 [Tulasnella sp. 424]|nr:hypothetical protein FRC04_010917 [Tulasnella sp. 424]KAG8975722.1 hypothetical protein FRC05_005240 [Tulasnella sp. 425]